MFLDKAGEHIADVMTMNRGYASIPTASAILDTSNYTFHAISYGKDADGFAEHAHKILSPSSDGIIKVTSSGFLNFSGYSTSTTGQIIEFWYKILPQSPSPTDTRLENNSTVPTYSTGVPDLGQYLNPIINSSLSSAAHLIGGFPAASGTTYKIFGWDGSLLISGTLSSTYNSSGIMDSSGFLTFHPGNASTVQAAYNIASSNNYFGSGVLKSCSSTDGFPNNVSLKWLLPRGDCGTLNLFGGVYHLGVWCLDIKEMLKQGYSPPYSFNPLNNIRKYRLFAKKTFNRDIINYTNNNAFKSLFETTGGWTSATIDGIVLVWQIRFC
jgi:hypothetical protein